MSLKRNVVANYFGQAWTGFIGLAFVPLYIKFLGMEAYGLIGVFTLLQTWLVLLDMGMSPTLSREIARYTAGIHSDSVIRNLVFTFEIICLSLALFIFLMLVYAADWLGKEWLNVNGLSESIVSRSISIMGCVAALRFVEGLYRGAIVGFQKLVWLNVVTSALATLRALGAIAVLIWIDSSIQAFFWWQAIVSAMTVLIFSLYVHQLLPRLSASAVFSVKALEDSWKFARGVLATTILTLMITQVDKVLLSRLLSLDAFGVYVFSASIVGVLFQLIGPISQAYYPRLTELVAGESKAPLVNIYHQGAQLMTVILTPAGLLLIAFGEPIIFAWTGDKSLSSQASIIVSVLALGTIFNGWMHLPYMLQLASGWSSFSVWVNLVGAIVLVPAIFWVAPNYGPVGAAWVWVIINLGYVLFSIHFMHLRLLPGEKSKWYIKDIFTPASAAGVVVAISYVAYPGFERFGSLVWIAFTGLFSYASALLASPEFKGRVVKGLSFIKYG